ncbi:MAG: Mfa1 family fimbria major subunit [Tannerellaceae bacterium]|nr:Mfa1 family fimbria major subunit [Tannerellaceae bacterium]
MGTGRYLIILFIGCIITSCTKEVIRIIDKPQGKSTISFKIKLGSQTGTRSAWEYDDYFPSPTPTVEEKDVSNVLLVIFKNIYLEEYEMYESGDFTLDEATQTITLKKTEEGEDEIELEPGQHFFYVILNIPEGLYLEIEPKLARGKFTLTQEEFEKQLMEVDFDYLKGTGENGTGFIMTNSQSGISRIVYSDDQCEDLEVDNIIELSAGRALAKVSLAYVPAKTGELHGSLSGITYTTVNHPSRMYLMPVIENNKLLTPHYNTNNIPSDYFIHSIRELSANEDAAEWLEATTWEKGEAADFTYCIENNVKSHLKSNTTGLVIRGTFTPAVWINDDGTVGDASPDGTFWRIAQIDKDGFLLTYTKGYYNEEPRDICQELGSDFITREYPKGICYYTYWLSTNGEHQVKRNDFHKIVITHIHGAGAPDIDDMIDPDVDPDPVPTWGRLVVYAMGWDDYPQIEEIGEKPEGEPDDDLGITVPGWEDGSQSEELEGGNNNVFD